MTRAFLVAKDSIREDSWLAVTRNFLGTVFGDLDTFFNGCREGVDNVVLAGFTVLGIIIVDTLGDGGVITGVLVDDEGNNV